MTEHAAVVFVFFFLAEYGSIVLMCILTSILFLGGYLLINNLDLFNSIILDLSSVSIFVKKDLNEFVRFIFYINQGAGSTLIVSIYDYIIEGLKYEILYYNNILIEGLYYYYFDILKNSSAIDGLLYGLVLGLKSSILIFVFI
jgi:NADH-ubiquinone oxidoreductase chain 1